MLIKNVNSLINYINKYYDNPKKMDIIRKNFPNYIQFCDENDINRLINRMLELDETIDIIYDNAEIINEKFGITAILNITRQMKFKEGFYFIRNITKRSFDGYYTINEYLEDLQNIGDFDYIIDNMEEIISISNIHRLLYGGILKNLKEIDEERLKECYPVIIGKIADANEKHWDKKFINSLTMIINEIAQNEKTDLSTLEYVNSGSFSSVYRLGNKVIKFGRKRVTDKIPYHRRVLQPLLRRKVNTGNENLYIEISEYIKPDNTIIDEDIYQVYKELRNDGIIWVDARDANLGRLEKDNIAYFNTWLNVKNESVGYIPETIKEDTPLQEGDFVIIDTDLLFREEEFDEKILDEMNINTDFYHKFEIRYQTEKSYKIGQKELQNRQNKENDLEER